LAVFSLNYLSTCLLEGKMFHYVIPRYESFSIIYKACFFAVDFISRIIL